ncbi:MAG: apiosidase-like domain-containing protein [Bacteroidales bacterium]
MKNYLCHILGVLVISSITINLFSQDARMIFDYDLRKGKPHTVTVTGGQWNKGWQTTGAKDERIVFDAGYPVKNGILEISFTAAEKPWASARGKINYAGIYQDPWINQNSTDGDLFFARTGNPVYRFSNVKAAGRRFDRSEFEPRLGDTTDWVPDGRTIHTIKFEWRDGIPVFHDSRGRKTVFPRDIVGSDTPIDSLRYVFIGSDRYTGLTVKGLRFTRVTLRDLGSTVSGPAPLRLHVHNNSWNLADENGKPVFLLAETAWGLVRNLSREDADFFLKVRRSQRFNAVAFVCLNPPNSKNYYGKKAFYEVNGRADITRPLITSGNNPADTSQYDYWDHLDYVLKKIHDLGMYAIVLPNWGTAVTSSRGVSGPEGHLVNRNNAYKYAFWLGDRYKMYPNIIWMLGGDVSAVYGEYDFRCVFRLMAEGLADGKNGKFSPDGSADYSGMLISYHPEKLALQSSDWFHNDEWLSFNSIQNWPELLIPCLQEELKISPAKPTWVFEGRYEGYHRFNYSPDQWGDWQVRQQAWQTAFSGAMGFTYGHESVLGFGKDGSDWKSLLYSKGAQSITHFAKFINYVDPANMLNLISGNLLIEGNEGFAGRIASDRITCARNVNGDFAMFYSACGRSITVKMRELKSDAPLFAWMYNPKTGNWYAGGRETPDSRIYRSNIKAGADAPDITFDFPGEPSFGNDWVLVLSQREWF